MKYKLILKSLDTDERITLQTDMVSREYAEQARKSWRRVLGGKFWTVDRRPGVDTLDSLAMTIEEIK